MKKSVFILSFICCAVLAKAQDIIDTSFTGVVTVNKDERINILGRKMAEYNEGLAKAVSRKARGYRLMLLSTTDRSQAMQLRSQLLQQYPDQKVYMTFQSPYIKLKFGNFLEKTEAERVRKQLSGSRLITGNVYIVAETIEIKPEKKEDEE